MLNQAQAVPTDERIERTLCLFRVNHWPTWILVLLKAAEPATDQRPAYEKALARVRDMIDRRLTTGSWSRA